VQASACYVGSDFEQLLAGVGVTFDEDALTFLREVQGQQDDSAEWGYALAYGLVHVHREAIQNLPTFDLFCDMNDALPAYPDHNKWKAQNSPLAPWERDLLGDVSDFN
jgi:hypothetical protein